MDEEGRTYGHQRQNSRKRKVKRSKGRGEEGDQSSMSRRRGKNSWVTWKKKTRRFRRRLRI